MRAGFDRLLLDPPRSGADVVLKQLPLKGLKRIVYVSCHPASLARDAGYLVNERGWKLRAAGVMDMFPHTAHVASIAMFEPLRPGLGIRDWGFGRAGAADGHTASNPESRPFPCLTKSNARSQSPSTVTPPRP